MVEQTTIFVEQLRRGSNADGGNEEEEEGEEMLLN